MPGAHTGANDSSTDTAANKATKPTPNVGADHGYADDYANRTLDVLERRRRALRHVRCHVAHNNDVIFPGICLSQPATAPELVIGKRG